MDRRAKRNLATTVLVGVAVVALALAFFRPTAEIIYQEPVTGVETATADTALVISRTQQGGFKLFGITFSSPTYRMMLSFTAPPGCRDVTARVTMWPTGDEACGAAGTFHGELAGGGITATGDTIVSVLVDVSKSCFEAAAVGDRWRDLAGTCPG